MRYLVVWTVDIDAETPTEAAEQALRYQRNPESIATYFEVQENPFGRNETIAPSQTVYKVDLTEGTCES